MKDLLTQPLAARIRSLKWGALSQDIAEGKILLSPSSGRKGTRHIQRSIFGCYHMHTVGAGATESPRSQKVVNHPVMQDLKIKMFFFLPKEGF